MFVVKGVKFNEMSNTIETFNARICIRIEVWSLFALWSKITPFFNPYYIIV